tara:strand:- start:2739 stop:5375 length:2637 start_codon:yes stop_codon:yes gene_type:complete
MTKDNILILGGGARERIIYKKLEGNNVSFYTGNNFSEVTSICNEKDISVVIPGSEAYLCAGITDYILGETTNIEVFGPTKEQAMIEGSKNYSKIIMNELDLPTAPFKYYESSSDLLDVLEGCSNEEISKIVIKYNGLAKGKGVYLPNNKEEALKSVADLYNANKNNWEGIVIEDKLVGTEVSVMGFCNGYTCNLMPQSQDYKRIYDGDKGPNTGGMGAISPVSILDKSEIEKVQYHMNLVVRALNYVGVLYAGIMKTSKGIYFLEFNCRMGDPETQAVLSLLETDLLTIIKSCMRRCFININWSDKYAAALVLAHKDYPYSKLEDKILIEYNNLDKTVAVYDANVFSFNNRLYTTGGRVTTLVSCSSSLQDSLINIYNNANKISYDGKFYRRDIGKNNVANRSNRYPNIAVMGSGNATSIEKLLINTKSIKLFITNSSKSTISTKAANNGIPFVYLNFNSCKTKKQYYEKVVNILRLFDIDIVILSGFMHIVPDILYNEVHTINIHPSLLPKYAGMMDMNIHNAVIKNKDIFTGCTLHCVTGTVDHGRILCQRQLKITSENPAELKNKIQELEKECIYDYIKNYNVNKKINYDIDIDEGNAFVKDIKNNIADIGTFAAEYKYKDKIFGASTDGCGSKLDMANDYDFLNTIGIDLVAMNVNDILCGGCKPLFFMDYIAIDKMDKERCNTILGGIIEGCDEAGCKLIGGETAEMKGIYLKNKLDLAGFVVGEKIHNFPSKDQIKPGFFLYGLRSSGIHSNGYTLVRKLIKNSEHPYDIKKVMTPTKIYAELLDLYKLYGNNIYGVAHITGGGFNDNIKRILPDKLSFKLNHWKFPDIFEWIQKESHMARDEMLSIFNCGYGIVIITNKEINIGEKIGRVV